MGRYIKFYLQALLETLTDKMREDRFQIIIKTETDNTRWWKTKVSW